MGVTLFPNVYPRINDRCFSFLTSDRKSAYFPLTVPPSKVPAHSLTATTPPLPVLPIYLFHGKNSPFNKALYCLYVARAGGLVDRIIRCIAGVVFGRSTTSLILAPKAHEGIIQTITEAQGRPLFFVEEHLHGKYLLVRLLPSC